MLATKRNLIPVKIPTFKAQSLQAQTHSLDNEHQIGLAN